MSITAWNFSISFKLFFLALFTIYVLAYFNNHLGGILFLYLSRISIVYLIFRLIVPIKFDLGFEIIKLGVPNIFNYLGIGFYIYVVSLLGIWILSRKFLKMN